MKWIKASERLPVEEQVYWCREGDDRYPMKFFKGGFHYIFSGWRPKEFIEWLDESQEQQQAGGYENRKPDYPYSTPQPVAGEQDELWEEILSELRPYFLKEDYELFKQKFKQLYLLIKK